MFVSSSQQNLLTASHDDRSLLRNVFWREEESNETITRHCKKQVRSIRNESRKTSNTNMSRQQLVESLWKHVHASNLNKCLFNRFNCQKYHFSNRTSKVKWMSIANKSWKISIASDIPIKRARKVTSLKNMHSTNVFFGNKLTSSISNKLLKIRGKSLQKMFCCGNSQPMYFKFHDKSVS